jgi:hypothetical protein
VDELNPPADERNPYAFAPQGVDLSRPSVARVYDYVLGGSTNWAVDREVGDKVIAAVPLARPIAQANRQFLVRVVRHLMRCGVRQFIDVGAGVPTMDHIHSVTDKVEPGAARVVYVDHEPVAVAHSQLLLEEEGDQRRHVALNGDLRAPERLWRQIAGTGVIDFTEPVALLMIAVLHIQQPDEHGHDIGEQIVARYRTLLSPGSYLAISHATDDGVPPKVADALAELRAMYEQSVNPVIFRTHREIAALFGDFELIDPGVTWAPSWHREEAGSQLLPDSFDHPNESFVCVGVGRKPA